MLMMFWMGCGEKSDDGEDVTQQEVLDTRADVKEDASVPEEVKPEKEICAPNCAGKECGTDGCGGKCGNCFNFEGNIDNGLCQADGICGEPVPACNCLGQQCGLDACGTLCGTCPEDFFCNDLDQCEEVPIKCEWTGFNSASDFSKLEKIEGEPGFTFVLQASTSEAPPLDAIVLEIDSRPPVSGPTGPGTYDAVFDSFSTGGLWLWMAKGWNGSSSETVLFPIQGEIEIVSLSDDGGQFKAILHDVAMQEGEVNPETNAVTIHEEGLVWCLDGVELIADVDLIAFGQYDPNDCVELGSGYDIGDNIRNFQLQNCKGQWINLHDFCGVGKALWIVATAGW